MSVSTFLSDFFESLHEGLKPVLELALQRARIELNPLGVQHDGLRRDVASLSDVLARFRPKAPEDGDLGSYAANLAQIANDVGPELCRYSTQFVRGMVVGVGRSLQRASGGEMPPSPPPDAS